MPFDTAFTTELVNPKVAIKLYSAVKTYEIESGGPNELVVEFDIVKDLDEEPNEAEIAIHNLSEGTRLAISSALDQDMPIEVFCTATMSFQQQLVSAFRGEIEDVSHKYTGPGHETRIIASSQKRNHRAFYIEKSYKKGTPRAQILKDLVAAVGLTEGDISAADTIVDSITSSVTFSGPAFAILQEYATDCGIYAYICDGIVYLSNIYMPRGAPPFIVLDEMLLSTPTETRRTDRSRIEMDTIVGF